MSPSPSPLLQDDYIALAGFRYALRKFLRFSKEFLASRDLSPEQYEALLAVRSFASEAGLLVGQLSERLQVRHHSTVALTKKMVARGLVTKERSSTDRRQVAIRLTQAGREALEAMAVVHREALRLYTPEIMAALRYLEKKD